ncbi:ATP-grasp domain-containing protein [Longispora urticae]
MSHVIVINRFTGPFADYAAYLDHDTQHVTYVTLDAYLSAVPPTAAEVLLVADLHDHATVRAALDPALDKYGPPALIVALHEQNHAVAVLLREEFDVPGPRTADVHRFLDKHDMLRAAEAVGVPVPEHALVTSRAELDAFAARVGWPVIAKRLRGAGSTGVTRLDGPDQEIHASPDSPLVVQRYLPHTVLHVDGYYTGEKLGPWLASEYMNVPGSATVGPLAFTLGEAVGSVELDDPVRLAAVEAFLGRIIPGMCAEPWVFHLELFLTPDNECVFLEVARRPGGGEIPFVWREVHGIDLMELEFRLQCAEVPEVPEFGPAERITGQLLVPALADVPYRVTAAPSMAGAPGLYAEVVPPVGTVVWNKISYMYAGGRFRFVGTDSKTVAVQVMDVAARYTVSSEPAD